MSIVNVTEGHLPRLVHAVKHGVQVVGAGDSGGHTVDGYDGWADVASVNSGEAAIFNGSRSLTSCTSGASGAPGTVMAHSVANVTSGCGGRSSL